MTHTSTQQPEALRLAHTLSGGKLIDDSTEWADTLHAAAAELRSQHARIEELEAQLSAVCVDCGHFRYRGRRVGFAAEYPMLKPEPLYTEQQVRALLAATQPTAQGLEADLTDAQIDEAFNQMPDGAAGFLKSWGYRQFARAVLAAQTKQGGQANG